MIRRYTIWQREGSGRFDLHIVANDRHLGWREFPTLEAARAAVEDGKKFDAEFGHTSVVDEHLLTERT